MKKKNFALVLVGLALAAVCGSVRFLPEETEAPEQSQQIPEISQQSPETVPVYTYPADGNEGDATCLGSYTTDGYPDAVAARLEGAELTNRQLRVWYSLTAGQYRHSGKMPQPGWSVPLDAQPCEADENFGSWQQFFLDRALNSWHSAQALALQAETEGVPKETAYQPDQKKHEAYLQDMPATRFLYGYYDSYVPNTMHQAYLDGVPEMLEQLAQDLGYPKARTLAEHAMGTDLYSLRDAVALYNLAYMYLTTLSYDLEPSDEEVQALLAEQQDAQEEVCVDLRHILLIPDEGTAEDGTEITAEEAQENCMVQGGELLDSWAKKNGGTEAAFADLAYRNSQERDSAICGGAYNRVARGQLIPELEAWCFDPARLPGDTAVIESDYGCHVVYFSGAETIAQAEARETLKAGIQRDIIAAAREKYPMEVSFRDISLTEIEAVLTMDMVLYPDVAHERFPEVPLYFQQDYPRTMYGAYPVASHGCGITSMAMLASYMTDDEQTVPEMCDRFGRYCLETGTNYTLFQNEPAGMNFFLREYTRKADEAKQALKEGYIVVSLQHKGYWTRGGHFIVIEEITEGDMVRVRDSNILNFRNLKAHKEDLHEWSTIPPQSAGYWIFDKKVTSIPFCQRCGEPDSAGSCIVQEYFCEICRTALLRRENYLDCLK